MSNIRLVAYRKATSSSATETQFELDLQEAPNVSLNFQFSDIKEPETRKGSYSQTFKLPFTDNNNSFFQNWYEVNLDTLVFNTTTKFDAIIYVGTVPQFEGSLQLKAVYQKAEIYEIVLMSSTSTLFTIIGDKMLKDIFKKDNGEYDNQYNHTFNETNLAASWSNSLQNTAGASLYDSTAGVSKIVYPISVTEDKFYYNPNEVDEDGNAVKRYLRLDQTEINAIGTKASWEYSVPISQFRPSIQIKTLFDTLIAKAGFTYTSTFLNSQYFGKLFMTTCNHLECSVSAVNVNSASFTGSMNVAKTRSWHTFSSDDSGPLSTGTIIVPANQTTALTNCSEPYDPDNVWNSTYNYFTKSSATMEEVSVKHIIDADNVVSAGQSGNIFLKVQLVPFDTATNTPEYGEAYDTIYYAMNLIGTTGGNQFDMPTHFLSLENMPLGSAACITMEAFNFVKSGGTAKMDLGNLASYSSGGLTLYNVGCGNIYNNIIINFSATTYGSEIDVAACIDPEITQKDFLKDIIQRFNLIISSDANDEGNLIIEPYNDFIGSGEIKYWTDKLDLSKEIVVKDTTSLQKKTVKLSDQEDVDLYNKSIKERYPEVNVFGHLKIDDIGNDFATGEFKNQSIFSPFINSQVYQDDNEQNGTFLSNMTVQYEFSYEEKDGVFENSKKVTKPKLFYYNGSPTNVIDTTGNTVTYYLHNAAPSVTAYSFTQYPVCTPFDITPTANGSYTLTTANKSLYWNATPPLVGNLTIFNYTNDLGNWFNNTLYGYYWKPYLDNIYSSNARIMECHLNLDEVDIFNFSFADEIFIKDTYWRILDIKNYEVGANASTKVTLIKSLDTRENCTGCDYIIGTDASGSNLLVNTYYLWCPEDDPDCDPLLIANNEGAFADPECCICNGGEVLYQYDAFASSNKYPCLANAGSLPLLLKSIYTASTILSSGQTKSLISGILGGRNMPLVRGVDTNKYSKLLMPTYGDDIVIKYKTKPLDTPQLLGESHRLILTGNTTGNTRSYAFAQGDQYGQPLKLPSDVNIVIRLKGIATVVGGTSATYTLGTTEAFAYYTAFKVVGGTATQLGIAGGREDFSIREGSNPTTCTLYIDVNNEILRFGLNDDQTDTKRIWSLTVDFDVNVVNNMRLAFDENWALYQNGRIIQLQNGDYLIWN